MQEVRVRHAWRPGVALGVSLILPALEVGINMPN